MSSHEAARWPNSEPAAGVPPKRCQVSGAVASPARSSAAKAVARCSMRNQRQGFPMVNAHIGQHGSFAAPGRGAGRRSPQSVTIAPDSIPASSRSRAWWCTRSSAGLSDSVVVVLGLVEIIGVGADVSRAWLVRFRRARQLALAAAALAREAVATTTRHRRACPGQVRIVGMRREGASTSSARYRPSHCPDWCMGLRCWKPPVHRS